MQWISSTSPLISGMCVSSWLPCSHHWRHLWLITWLKNSRSVILIFNIFRVLSIEFCVIPEKIHTHPPHGRLSEIPRGRVVLKVKILEAKYEAQLEFPGGRWGAKHTFSGTAHYICQWNITPSTPWLSCQLLRLQKGSYFEFKCIRHCCYITNILIAFCPLGC